MKSDEGNHPFCVKIDYQLTDYSTSGVILREKQCYLIFEVAVMKKGNIRVALFTGIFLGIVNFIFEYLIPDANLFTSIVISVVGVLVGWLIGSKLFPGK